MMQNMDSPSSSINSSSTTRPILSLGLSIQATNDIESSVEHYLKGHSRKSLFVKVYMEGIPIGRKLNLMAHHGYHDLIKILHLMFDCNTTTNTILWAEQDEEESCQRRKQYVLTYQDHEGDWLMVGDVPWEMFLNAVTRLQITQIDRSVMK